MEKMQLIINPNSGDEKGLEVKNELEAIYQEKGIETSIYITTGEDNFKEIIQDSMGQGYKKIVLSGGDGTISELVNGISGLEERPKIILLPSGTTNNFARTLTGDKTRREILQAIKEDNLKELKVDIGRINDKYFISSIAVGMLPAVGWETDENLKAELGSFAYVLEGLKLVREEEQKTFNLNIEAEGKSLEKDDVFLFIVGLSNSIFGVKTFFEKATVNDGKLHYFGLKQAGIVPEIQSLLKQIMPTEEKQVEDEQTFTGHFKTAKIKSASDLNFLIDGEKGLTFPVELSILPKHLTFILPNDKFSK